MNAILDQQKDFMGDASIRKDEGLELASKAGRIDDQSPTQTSKTRETFESWYDNHHGTDLAKCRITIGQTYFYTKVESAWRGYQAATAAAEAKYLPVIEVLAKAVISENYVSPLQEQAYSLAAPLLKGEK